MSLSAGRGALALAALLLPACAQLRSEIPRPAPPLQQRSFAQGAGALRRVAILPFAPRIGPSTAGPGSEVAPEQIAALVTAFVGDALAARGIPVVPASDLAQALGEASGGVPVRDAERAARVAAEAFGATSVVTGAVLRYREREGEALGASRPASVAFEVSLHEAPTGFRLWTSRFDETQQPLSENLFNARRYPGGGTRWLTAGELARWGAGEVATALAARR
jgi:hypothetical protein